MIRLKTSAARSAFAPHPPPPPAEAKNHEAPNDLSMSCVKKLFRGQIALRSPESLIFPKAHSRNSISGFDWKSKDKGGHDHHREQRRSRHAPATRVLSPRRGGGGGSRNAPGNPALLYVCSIFVVARGQVELITTTTACVSQFVWFEGHEKKRA